MKRISTVLLAALLLTIATATAASAAPTGTFIIPIDTWVEAPTGSVTQLASVDTPPDLIGATCVGVALAVNGSSVHPNNDLIIESDSTSVVLKDVERESNETTPAIGELTLGPVVTVSLLMGDDGQFSGGLEIFIDTNCTPPTTTTTTTTTTTLPPTTTTVPPTTTPPGDPAIEIVKTATPEFYGEDGIGHFTIEVHNPGPHDLTNVHVTDALAIAMDPTSNCPTTIGDLAVDATFTYSCTVGNLDGKSIFDNEATAIGTGPQEKQVTATDEASVFPPVEATTITAAPSTTQAPTTTSAPSETLPVTGVSSEHLLSFGIAGIALVLLGLITLGGATAIGQYRKDH